VSPYITFRDTDKLGELQYYILQRDFPHYVGCISSVPVNWAIIQVGIPGYNLWVVFSGVLQGNFIPSYADVKDELSLVFGAMAQWYLTNRILTDEKKYKKWLSNAPSTM
jgi:hypothetical protein